MKRLQTQPDPPISIPGGGIIFPIATLVDEHGGKSHITVDDSCYVLYNSDPDKVLVASSSWFDEAVEAVRNLPMPSESRSNLIRSVQRGDFNDFLKQEEIEWIKKHPSPK